MFSSKGRSIASTLVGCRAVLTFDFVERAIRLDVRAHRLLFYDRNGYVLAIYRR